MAELKRYGTWAGNEEGVIEDPARCIESVYGGRGFIESQCSRKRGHGPDGNYCKQHAKRIEGLKAIRNTPLILTAHIQITAYEVTCPYCNEAVPDASGSYMWVTHEAGNELKCPHCKREFRLPSKLE